MSIILASVVNVSEREEIEMDKSSEKVSDLAISLSHVRKRRDKMQLTLKRLEGEEREIAFRLNTALGIVPIKEAAERIKVVMDRAREMSSRQKSEMMKRVWASKTVEEREEWKGKLRRRKTDG
jgi:hypothetical protein